MIMARMLRTMVSRLAGGKREFRGVQFLLQMLEQSHQSGAGGGNRYGGAGADRRRVIGGVQPFIAQEQHRLAQIEGREFGGGDGDHAVAQAHLVIVQPGALAAEQQGGPGAPASAGGPERVRAAASGV